MARLLPSSSSDDLQDDRIRPQRFRVFVAQHQGGQENDRPHAQDYLEEKHRTAGQSFEGTAHGLRYIPILAPPASIRARSMQMRCWAKYSSTASRDPFQNP